MKEAIEKAIEERNEEIANLLWNTGKLTKSEIKEITGVSPSVVDGMHGVEKPHV